jgi:2-polyprenyl-3-methyl-5-hydroxy-6-metoxy-1,4-benzoquinol methylase
MKASTEFWDQLAAHHAAIENSYFNLPSIRAIFADLQSPVLIVGAGQGLILAELKERGISCDGLDSSPEMIRHALLRRGLTLIKGDARSMPFPDQSYGTIIYATGVIDFLGDEQAIAIILKEGQRVVKPTGKTYVAFYRLSDVLEQFTIRIGLLKDNLIAYKASLQSYLLTPLQMLRWVNKQANVSTGRALALLLSVALRTTYQEKRNTFRMQKILSNPQTAEQLIQSAPEQMPYRNEAEIRRLFARLAMPIKNFQTLKSCFLVQI